LDIRKTVPLLDIMCGQASCDRAVILVEEIPHYGGDLFQSVIHDFAPGSRSSGVDPLSLIHLIDWKKGLGRSRRDYAYTRGYPKLARYGDMPTISSVRRAIFPTYRGLR
jgi:hypothetical protein